MIIYYEGIYGIVDAEELLYLMDMTPRELYRMKVKNFRRSSNKNRRLSSSKSRRDNFSLKSPKRSIRFPLIPLPFSKTTESGFLKG
jgi:hypothetical protein